MKMKAITAVCATGASVPAIANGRVARPPRDGENAEIQMYLSKLKDLVPFMPKNRKLSKLEIIQHVIDYICDLQSELETHPDVNNFDAAAALQNLTEQQQNLNVEQQNERLNDHQEIGSSSNAISSLIRQPLGVRQSPNTILAASSHPQNSRLADGASGNSSELSLSASLQNSHTTTETTDRSQC